MFLYHLARRVGRKHDYGVRHAEDRRRDNRPREAGVVLQSCHHDEEQHHTREDAGHDQAKYAPREPVYPSQRCQLESLGDYPADDADEEEHDDEDEQESENRPAIVAYLQAREQSVDHLLVVGGRDHDAEHESRCPEDPSHEPVGQPLDQTDRKDDHHDDVYPVHVPSCAYFRACADLIRVTLASHVSPVKRASGGS